MLRALAICVGLTFVSTLAFGQAASSEVMTGQLKAGAAISFVHLDYSLTNPKSFTGYVDYDFLWHVGAEAEYRYASSHVSESNILVGPRIEARYRGFTPYIKTLVGRGGFNSPGAQVLHQNGSFNMVSYGAGIDYSFTNRISIRLVDFEYQKWLSFPPRDLQPNVLSFGAAYRFK